MGLLDNLGKINVSRQAAGEQKSKPSPEESRLTAQIAEFQRQQDAVYLQLGKRYVELFEQAPAPELAGFLDTIHAIGGQIKDCEQQRRSLKGLVLCERCGAEQDKSAAFCSCCGNRLIPEDAVICPNCRSILPAGTMFCTECGTRLGEAQTNGG